MVSRSGYCVLSRQTVDPLEESMKSLVADDGQLLTEVVIATTLAKWNAPHDTTPVISLPADETQSPTANAGALTCGVEFDDEPPAFEAWWLAKLAPSQMRNTAAT